MAHQLVNVSVTAKRVIQVCFVATLLIFAYLNIVELHYVQNHVYDETGNERISESDDERISPPNCRQKQKTLRQRIQDECEKIEVIIMYARYIVKKCIISSSSI